MKRKFELGQTIYWIYNTPYNLPEIHDSVIKAISSTEKNDKEGVVIAYSTHGDLFFESGDKWYVDRGEAGRAMIDIILAEIDKTKTRLSELKKRMEATKVLCNTEEPEEEAHE